MLMQRHGRKEQEPVVPTSALMMDLNEKYHAMVEESRSMQHSFTASRPTASSFSNIQSQTSSNGVLNRPQVVSYVGTKKRIQPQFIQPYYFSYNYDFMIPLCVESLELLVLHPQLME